MECDGACSSREGVMLWCRMGRFVVCVMECDAAAAEVEEATEYSNSVCLQSSVCVCVRGAGGYLFMCMCVCDAGIEWHFKETRVSRHDLYWQFPSCVSASLSVCMSASLPCPSACLFVCPFCFSACLSIHYLLDCLPVSLLVWLSI